MDVIVLLRIVLFQFIALVSISVAFAGTAVVLVLFIIFIIRRKRNVGPARNYLKDRIGNKSYFIHLWRTLSLFSYFFMYITIGSLILYI